MERRGDTERVVPRSIGLTMIPTALFALHERAPIPEAAPLAETFDVSTGRMSIAFDSSCDGTAVAALLTMELIWPAAELARDSTELIRLWRPEGIAGISGKSLE